jgi:hypothetical protein
VVIIVFGHEVGEINQSHLRAQPRVTRGVFEIAFTGASKTRDENRACPRKAVDQLWKGSPIVVGFMRPTIRQIGSGQVCRTTYEVFRALQPQRLQVGHVPDLLRQAPAGINAG